MNGNGTSRNMEDQQKDMDQIKRVFGSISEKDSGSEAVAGWVQYKRGRGKNLNWRHQKWG